MTATLDRLERTITEGVPRLVAVHTERPETVAWYRNGLVYGPRLTPWTWRYDDPWNTTVTWASMWAEERCLSRTEVVPPVRLGAGDTFTFTVMAGEHGWGQGWEPVPIPTTS